MKIIASFQAIVFSFLVLTVGCGRSHNTDVTKHTHDANVKLHNHVFFSMVQSPESVRLADPVLAKKDLETPSGLFTNKPFPRNEPPHELQISKDYTTLLSNAEEIAQQEVWKSRIAATPGAVSLIPITQNEPQKKYNFGDVVFSPSDFDTGAILENPYLAPSATNPSLGAIHNGYFQENGQNVSQLFVVKYLLRTSKNDNTKGLMHYGIASIPVDKTHKKPLIVFAHGGDFGTSFSEIASILRNNMSNYIVVAPLYPGEGLCPQAATQNYGCTKYIQGQIAPDTNVAFRSSSVPEIGSVTAVNTPRSPMGQDVISYLGIYQAVIHEYQNNSVLFSQLSVIDPTTNADKAFSNYMNFGTLMPLVPMQSAAPHTLGLSASRGGITMIAAMGELGLLMSANHTTFALENEYKDFQFPLFSGLMFLAPPTSFLTGELRLVFQTIMNNQSAGEFEKLPMVPDLLQHPAIANFRNDPSPGVYKYDTKLKKEKLVLFDLEKNKNDSLTNIVNFVAMHDMTFLAPFVSTAVQNWDTYSLEFGESGLVHTMSPGSAVFLHGSADQVVPVSESTIGNEALSGTWSLLYGTSYSHSHNQPLEQWQFSGWNLGTNLIFPGLGSTQFTFQPTDQFYNQECDPKALSADKKPEVFYNTRVQRCFGNGFSPEADGQSAGGFFHDHLDTAFFTGHLINALDPVNADQNLFLLTAKNGYTFQEDMHNMAIFEDCDPHNYFEVGEGSFTANAWSHKCIKHSIDANSVSWGSMYPSGMDTIQIPLQSPIFKRYMADESKTPNLMNSIAYGNFNDQISDASGLTPPDVIQGWLKTVGSTDGSILKNGKKTQISVFHDFKNH